jgi:hypothetical protein
MMEPICTHKQQNTEKKERKRGSLSWRWHPFAPKNNKTKRKKGGADLCQKLAMAPTKTKTKTKKKKNK